MSPNKTYIQKAVRIAGWLLVVAAFLYIGIKAYRTPANAFLDILQPRTAFIVLLLSLLYSLLNIVIAGAWSIIAYAVSENTAELRGLFSVHLKTEVIKYVPGNVFHFAGRHFFSEETGLTQRSTLISNILEVCTVLSALGFSLAAFYGENAIHVRSQRVFILFSKYWAMIAATALFIAGVSISSLIKRDKYFFCIALPGAFAALVLYISFFAGTSLLFLCLGSSLTGMPLSMLAFRIIAGIFCVAWASGFLIPGAPGGLGVRESVLITLLSPVWGEGSAIASAILFRLITITGDMLAFFWGIMIAPRGISDR